MIDILHKPSLEEDIEHFLERTLDSLQTKREDDEYYPLRHTYLYNIGMDDYVEDVLSSFCIEHEIQLVTVYHSTQLDSAHLRGKTIIGIAYSPEYAQDLVGDFSSRKIFNINRDLQRCTVSTHISPKKAMYAYNL